MIVEVTVTIFMFLTILFGIAEFSYAFYQWNIATKATQLGARLAAVSDPVSTSLIDLTTTISGFTAGQSLPSGAYDFVCDGSASSGAGSCTCSSSLSPSLCPGSINFTMNNLRKIVYGRCDTGETCSSGARTACNSASTFDNFGMCNVFSNITTKNVIVRYQYTGLGYVGRPSSRPVPTVTVQLVDVPFQFILLGGLMGFGTINMPGLATTITGEDLNPNAPS